MQTRSGRRFWPLDPRPEEIHIVDIAAGLSMHCRYSGQCSQFYSVAEHAVLVSRHVAPEFAREALLHDSAEAYIGDMIRPLKHQPEMIEFRNAETVIEIAVCMAFGLRTERRVWDAVKEIDDRILVDEVSALMAKPDMYFERLEKLEPLGAEINGYNPATAEFYFMMRFFELFPEAGPGFQ